MGQQLSCANLSGESGMNPASGPSLGAAQRQAQETPLDDSISASGLPSLSLSQLQAESDTPGPGSTAL